MVLFSRRGVAGERGRNAALELMQQARAILNIDDDTVISVREHDCGDPGCGSARTVVLVLRPDRPTEAVKIDKSIERVTKSDLSAALAPLLQRQSNSATSRSATKPTRRDW
jgi:hypothetical protein